HYSPFSGLSLFSPAAFFSPGHSQTGGHRITGISAVLPQSALAGFVLSARGFTPGNRPRLVAPHTTRAGHERRRAVPRTTDPGYGRQPYRPAAADLTHQPGASTPAVVCPRGG